MLNSILMFPSVALYHYPVSIGNSPLETGAFRVSPAALFQTLVEPLTELSMHTHSILTAGQFSWPITRFQESLTRDSLLPDSPLSSLKHRDSSSTPEAYPPKPWLFWTAWH